MKTLRIPSIIMLVLGFLVAYPSLTKADNIYLVNTNNDDPDSNPGDGLCLTGGGLCSLRAAMMESNADNEISVINFTQKFLDVNHIDGCYLPTVTGPNTTIDAGSQWDTLNNRPGVAIRSGGCDTIVLNSSNNVIRGISISANGINDIGLWIQGNNNVIGGTGTHQRNTFTGEYGVQVDGGYGNEIIGNFFGTIDGVVKVPSRLGLFLWGPSGTYVSNNVFMGHSEQGVLIYYADGNTVANNVIGSDEFMTSPYGNSIGVQIWSGHDNTIGPNNWIVGNLTHGVELKNGSGNQVHDNIIGGCSNSLGNVSHGIHVFNDANDSLQSNQIFCNGGSGIHILGSDTTIKGNAIGQNSLDGIRIEGGAHTVIGGSTAADRNSISGNGSDGIQLNSSLVYGTEIQGNWIGLANGAFDAGNQGHGIHLSGGSYSNVIGGMERGQANWIGFNDKTGIYLTGTSTSGNLVYGNVIGAPINWAWPAGNGNHGIGVYDGADGNYIGSLGLGNTVLSSGWSGIVVVNADQTLISSNKVGTDGAAVNWGNSYYGLHIVDGAENVAGLNEITFNGTHANEPGVRIQGGAALFNTLTANSIHDHVGPGIELYDYGNMELGSPSISSAICSGPITGTACPDCTVELYSDSGDEGQYYEGTVTASGSGAFSYNFPVNGPNVTALHTHPTGSSSGFSAPFSVGPCNTPPSASFTVTPSSGSRCQLYEFDASGSTDGEDPSANLAVRWDWDGNGYYDTVFSVEKIAQYRFPESGLYNVHLQVLDTGGLVDETAQMVTVTGVSCGLLFLPLVMR